MVNVAIVGAGFMGKTHLTAYQAMKNVKVTAVCDLGEAAGKALAEAAAHATRKAARKYRFPRSEIAVQRNYRAPRKRLRQLRRK